MIYFKANKMPNLPKISVPFSLGKIVENIGLFIDPDYSRDIQLHFGAVDQAGHFPFRYQMDKKGGVEVYWKEFPGAKEKFLAYLEINPRHPERTFVTFNPTLSAFTQVSDEVNNPIRDRVYLPSELESCCADPDSPFQKKRRP